MLGVIKKKLDNGFGFIEGDGQEGDIFFHSNELIDISFDELRIGDSVTYETEMVSRKRASNNTIRNGDFLQSLEEQKIVACDEFEAIELQKKVGAELITLLSRNPQDLFKLNAKEFEEVIAEIYVINGYTAELLGAWNQADGGIDIVVVRGGIGSSQFRMAIQCKRYASKNRVSAAPIRSLAGVLDRFHAHAGLIVTTSDFTKPAREEAESFFWKVSLMNYQGIVEALRKAELIVGRPATFSTDPPNPVEIEKVVEFRAAIGVSRV